jgi:hypothetical protein
VTIGLGVQNERNTQKINNLIQDEEKRLIATAHWINDKKISLNDSYLTTTELEKIAPYLQNIDLLLLDIEDPESFLKKCSNAYSISISSNQLKNLSGLSQELEELICIDCENLEQVDLSTSEKLKVFNCSGSTHLTTIDISKNEALEELMINDCTNLQSIGVLIPETINTISCLNSFNLVLPELSESITVNSNRLQNPFQNQSSLIQNEEYFRVTSDEIESDPLKLLLRLGEELSHDTLEMPKIIYVDPTTGRALEAIDAGGLQRQFITTLSENLFKEGSQFPFTQEGEYKTPILKDFTDPNIKALKTFARMVALSATSSLLLGTALDPSIFHACFSLTDEEIDSIDTEKPLREDLKTKIYAARQGVTVEDLNEEDLNEINNDQGTLSAIGLIAKELKNSLQREDFNRFKEDIPLFMESFQGHKVTAESLKEHIKCDNPIYKKWIEDFIDTLDENPLEKEGKRYELKHLVMLFTGSYTLDQENITLEVYNERTYTESNCIIHTCTKTMELPHDLTEELLIDEIKGNLFSLNNFNAS